MGISPLPILVPFFWGRFFNEMSIKFTGRVQMYTNKTQQETHARKINDKKTRSNSSGYADQYDSTIVHGDIGNLDYTKYYIL